MSIVTFDTSIFIAYQPGRLPTGFRMSAVVIQELTAGAVDASEVKRWDAAWRAHEKERTLLVPTAEDWWLAGKVLNSLLRGLRSQHGGRTPRLAPAEKQRIIRDVLLARSARAAGALVVTDNAKDFEQIKRFCAVRTMSGKTYFGR